VATAIDIGNPLMNTKDERVRIHALLKHLGSGAVLREFPATASEKVALVKTASQRRLITWHRGRNRYELTSAGWCELAPSRRFGVGSMMLGTTVGATLGAAVLGVFWLAAGVSHGHLVPQSAAVSPPHANVAAAVNGAVSSPAPLGPAATPAVQTATPAAPPSAVPARDAEPAAAPPVATEPTKVADQPAPEQPAEAAAKAKQLAAKKARQRAASRRRKEEAARAWAAADPWRTRQAESSGYGGYGGQSSGFAYR
jgi:hypothetical protein